jgi:hypothetical protein
MLTRAFCSLAREKWRTGCFVIFGPSLNGSDRPLTVIDFPYNVPVLNAQMVVMSRG